MKTQNPIRSLIRLSACLAGLAALPALAQQTHTPTFSWINTDSDIPGVAPTTDPYLVDPMGLVFGEEGQTFWVADNATGVMTRYGLHGGPIDFTNGTTGSITPEVITIPPANGNTVGSPTGLVIDHASYSTVKGVAANEFLIPGTGTTTVPSHFLTVTEDGEVCGFNPNSAAAKGTVPSATVGATVAGADYKGAAIAYVNTSTTTIASYQHFLFAANFATGNIDVFNNAFGQVTTGSGVFPGTFSDADAGFAPINVKRYSRIDPLTKKTLRVLLVAYAEVNPSDTTQPLPGAGNGYITVFSLGAPDDQTAGTKIGRLVGNTGATNGLNVPYGMALAYGSSQAKDTVLVANNGSGEIHSYSLAGVFGPSLSTPATDKGALQGRNGALNFSGLWGVHFQGPVLPLPAFANDDDELLACPPNLYFSAGLLNGNDGLTGYIFPNGFFGF